jgi:uncharacterized membrane protein
MDSTPPPVTSPAAPPPAAAATEDKTVAIVAYITLIGFIAAIVIHSNKKTQLGSFHLRQMLGFFLTTFGGFILAIIPVIGWLALPFFYIGLIVLWVMGLIAAIKGEMKPMPLVGPLYQKWFANTFN